MKCPNNLLLHDGHLLAQGYDVLIGADEAGRGPLAGPVVAGAVCINKTFYNLHVSDETILLFQDSKVLSENQREQAYNILIQWAQEGHLWFAQGEASVDEIDTNNILCATTSAFRRALEHLKKDLPSAEALFQTQSQSQTCLIIDGCPLKKLPYLHTSIVKGDRTSFCIAAASIVAKVYRDHIMNVLAQKHPQYHFENHKGYGTAEHIALLKQYGACAIHRKTFLKKILKKQPRISSSDQLALL